MTITGRLF